MSFHEGLDDLGTYYQIRKVDGTTPILFIHGVGLDHSMWSPQTNFFKNQTTIVYDLIGHGYSTCTQNEINFEDFSYQIESLLQILQFRNLMIGAIVCEPMGMSRKFIRVPDYEKLVAVSLSAFHSVKRHLWSNAHAGAR